MYLTCTYMIVSKGVYMYALDVSLIIIMITGRYLWWLSEDPDGSCKRRLVNQYCKPTMDEQAET